MEKLDIDRIKEIFKDWRDFRKDEAPFIKPQGGGDSIPYLPIPNPSLSLAVDERPDCDPKYIKRRNERRDEIKAWLEGDECKIIKEDHDCYLYITFRNYNNNQSFFNVDSLLKEFFDTIEGTLFLNDKCVIGVRANLVKVSCAEREGTSFTLIPTLPAYKLDIISVSTIRAKEDFDKLHELRIKYWTEINKAANPPEEWKHPMQMIETNYGTFFDSRPGYLWGVDGHGEEFKHKPEPGFNWKPTNMVTGAMIFERSSCWWINKWAEEPLSPY